MEIKVSDIRPLYGFLDPHGGQADTNVNRLKRIASSAAICVGGQDAIGRYFILDAWADRVSTDDLIEKLYEVCARWNLRKIGAEANGMAGLFNDAMARDAREANRHLPILSVHQPTHIEKDYRIRTTLQPLTGNGRLCIARHLTNLISQITAFPLSGQKDLIDACASLCRFMPSRPREAMRTTEKEGLARYLRDRGVDPAIIGRETGLRQ